jgi:hypothetical protein
MLQALLPFAGKLIDKLIPDPEAKIRATAELARMAQEGELARMANDTRLIEIDQSNVTARWTADMSSDSWLSKNIRPMSLIAIFLAYIVFAMMSTFGYSANEAYVTLLGQWGIIIFGAYFTSRGAEKIIEMRGKK